MIDYFLPIPIKTKLAADVWGAADVGPRDVDNGLEDRDLKHWCYWDGAVIQGADGKWHMFASRWPQQLGHSGWKQSLAVHAVSDDVLGPYIDKGVCWPDNMGGKGHNVTALTMPDGRYAITISDTRPGEIFASKSPDGPWESLGKITVQDQPNWHGPNVMPVLRPDGQYMIVQRSGEIMLSKNITGPYVMQGPSIYPQVQGLTLKHLEDPVAWFSGGLYHIVVNSWSQRKAFHLTSPDGITHWTLRGLAYDPTTNFIRYTDGTVNHWDKIERPGVIMKNGHVTHFTFAVVDVPKENDKGNDNHGSKVIVVPFDGEALDRGLAQVVQHETTRPSTQPQGGFLFSTFRDETTPMSEQIYFGISEDGKHWEALNGGNPVLVSDVGEKGVRDSFLLRSHDGKKVWLIATDLCVHHNRDWKRNTRAGSRSLVVWESTDLVHWSPPRLATVAPDDAGCAWAPEAIYDEEAGDYLVYWASTTKRDNYAKQCIWAARTKDFRTFDKPFIYVEKPNHVIDIDIARDGDNYYRFTKDDKDKSVSMAMGKKLTGPWQDIDQFASGKGKNFEGPICFELKPAAAGQTSQWCLLLDNVSDRIGPGAFGYVPFITDDLSTGKFMPARDFHFPYPFRHGSVLPITAAERERLKSAYPATQHSGLADPLPLRAIEKDRKGLTVKLGPGTLRLEVCSDRILRVSYSPTESLPARQEFSVVKQWADAPFTVNEDDRAVTVSTPQMSARVDRATGALAFADASGRTFLQETPTGGKKMTPAKVNGESTFTVEQSFVSPADEVLLGMCQAQDGVWNWRGIPIELRQQNTQTAIPVLVSSKGYGLLWNNASLTDFNPVDNEIPLTLEDPAMKIDSGGPTATEQIGKDGGKKPAPLAAHHGTFISGTEGEYVFFAKNGDRKKALIIEVDNKRIGGIENFWVPYTAVGKVRLPAKKSCNVKVIGGGKDVKLFARPLGDTTTFRSQVGETIDYYVFYGPRLDDVIAGIRTATGDVPMWPKWAFGFWQCRERYSSQKQILDTVAEFRKRNIPLDLLVQDWQYWGKYGWGAYQWDERGYPDPKAMIEALHAQNTKFMVSVWSNPSGPVKDELAAKGLLIGKEKWVDAFDPTAREIRWKYLNDAFFKIGTDAWWQDATEPGDDGNALNDAKTSMGSGNRMRNAYPLFANRTVYDAQRHETDAKRVVILTRSFYPGQQRYASALWSGDIGSTWDSLRRQIPAGLHACMTGMPYWTTDCGGFFRPKDQHTSDDFNQLLVRWFQYSTFCPILRIHGFQSETEMWKYPKAYDTLLKYDRLRYRLLPYNYSLAWQVTDKGYTMMRALPLDFPADAKALQISDQYMFGPAFLVSPVTTPNTTSRMVYLPALPGPPDDGQWINFWTGKRAKGGQMTEVAAPLDTIPLFVRAGSIIPLGPDVQYATASPSDPIELRVYRGANGAFTLYDDAGDSYKYEKGERALIPIAWDQASQTLTIGKREGSYPQMQAERTFNIVWVTEGHAFGDTPAESFDAVVQYKGDAIKLSP